MIIILSKQNSYHTNLSTFALSETAGYSSEITVISWMFHEFPLLHTLLFCVVKNGQTVSSGNFAHGSSSKNEYYIIITENNNWWTTNTEHTE